MKIDTIKLCEKVLSFYKNNCELKDNLSESDMGYYQALADVMNGKYS